MKKAYFILFLLLLGACEKWFHEEEISIGEIESVAELESAVNGVYSFLAEVLMSENEGFYCPNIKGDDLSNEYPYYDNYWTEINTVNCSEQQISNTYIKNESYNWKCLYSTIVSANNILVQKKNIVEKNASSLEILGEVFFLRAYCYFRLTRTYGRIPLIDDIEIDYSIPPGTFVEIYQFIENDFKSALKYLPDNNANARIPYVTPHRGTAKALLAELYLNWGGYPIGDKSKYEKATQIAGEVIDSAAYFGFELLEDFAFLWDKNHLYNSESVFSLYFNNPENTTVESEMNQAYRASIRDLQSLDSSDYAYYIHELGFYFFATERNFYDLFPQGYRKEITFYTRNYLNSTNSIYHYKHSMCNIRLGYRKFFYDPFIYEFIFSYNGQNYSSYSYLGNSRTYLYRFVHTLLTFAEASARAGILVQKSYDCVNYIRRRARNLDLYSTSIYDLQPGLSEQNFIDSVLWERAWELAGETEGRWFDLVRTQQVELLEQYRYNDEGGMPKYPLDEEDYYFSPPKEDQILNPNLTF